MMVPTLAAPAHSRPEPVVQRLAARILAHARMWREVFTEAQELQRDMRRRYPFSDH